MNKYLYALCALCLVAPASATRAEVASIEITTRHDVADGKAFGTAGAYEEIVGKVHYALDPADPHNKAIVDLDKAPRDAAGRVTFTGDLLVLTPKDAARRNGVALFDIVNRGRKNSLRDFNQAPPSFDPKAPVDLGDGFLMQQGYTLVFAGWQFDVAGRPGLLGLEAPPTLENG